jgi:translation initiation factor 2 beta subunit (eIF-2beta)/eIF-5
MSMTAMSKVVQKLLRHASMFVTLNTCAQAQKTTYTGGKAGGRAVEMVWAQAGRLAVQAGA